MYTKKCTYPYQKAKITLCHHFSYPGYGVVTTAGTVTAAATITPASVEYTATAISGRTITPYVDTPPFPSS